MFVVLGLALAVVLAVIGVFVLGGSDDDERVGSDDRGQLDEPDQSDETVTTDPTDGSEPPDTDVAVETAPPATQTPEVTAPVTEPTDTEPPSEPTGDVIAGAPVGGRGTRDAPVGVGEVADIGSGWRLQVLDVVADATAIVAAENSFNDPPPAGSTFTIVRVALGYFGIDDPQSFFMPTISAVGAEAVELDTDCGVIPDQFDLFSDAFAGGVSTGNICFVTTPADVPVLQLSATGEFFSDTDVFLAANTPGAAMTPITTMRGAQPGAVATELRASAAAVGTQVDVGSGWSFTVMSPARDITDEVLAENPFNTAPPDGLRMVGVDVTVAFNGSGTASAFELTMKWVDNGNLQRDGYCGVVPGEFDQFADVPGGGSVTGTMCFLVPAEDVGTGTIYVSLGFEEPVWVATT